MPDIYLVICTNFSFMIFSLSLIYSIIISYLYANNVQIFDDSILGIRYKKVKQD